MTDKFHFQCINCGKTYSPAEVQYFCPECEKENSSKSPPKGVLKTIYNFENIIKSVLKPDSIEKPVGFPELDFFDLLPLFDKRCFPLLKIGQTPLYKTNSLRGENLPFDIFLKDDSQNPTFSFKDRASAVVSAYAKENEIKTIVTASTGNAGSSIAGICASQQQKAIVFVPASAPQAKLTQIVMYGATIIPVDGTYDDAFDLSIEASKHYGFYNRNTAYNPLTIEGKKTVSFEIALEMNFSLPDRVFVPVGDGVIISGVYKGFEDLLKIGLINKMPVIVAVQAKGSDNLTRNIFAEEFISKPSRTIADSIAVDIPRNFYMASAYIKEYHGEFITVSDNEILDASVLLSNEKGIFTEPASAAAYAGLIKYIENHKFEDKSKNLVLLTGSGLKDLTSIQSKIEIPKAIKPCIDEIEKIIKH
ncbi:MAG: threonine synthase [Bacteroidales bacterium]|nr:threonine synthase [Bacteroidales bacterium]